jgi:hypothetical protein
MESKRACLRAGVVHVLGVDDETRHTRDSDHYLGFRS